MGSLGPAEILVILVIALIVLGPEKLPDAAKQAGRFIAEIRRIGSGFQAELKDAIDTTVNTTSNPSTTAGSLPPTTPAPGAPPGPSPDLAGHVPPAPQLEPQPPPSAHPPPTDPSV